MKKQLKDLILNKIANHNKERATLETAANRLKSKLTNTPEDHLAKVQELMVLSNRIMFQAAALTTLNDLLEAFEGLE